MSQLKHDIRNFIVDTFLFGQDDGLTNDSSFLARGVIDSTGVLELVAHLESAYQVKVLDNELLPENLDSIDAVDSFVRRKRGVT